MFRSAKEPAISVTARFRAWLCQTARRSSRRFVEARPELWQWGVPAALAGQGALLIGFVLQLDGVWQASRANTQQLAQNDIQLSGLAQSIQMLNVTQSGPSQSFYAHYAAGARPELLMADLRSQLDLLASRMSNE